MSDKDLFGLFGLADPAVTEAGAKAPASVLESAAAPAGPRGENFLALDAWGRRKGAEWAEVEGPGGPVAVGEALAQDVRAAFYEPAPVPAPGGCADRLKEEFLRGLMESEDYQSAHRTTMLSEELSRVAFDRTCLRFLKLREEVEKKRGAETKKPGKPSPDEGTGGGEPSPDEMAACAAAAGKAAKEAREEADAAEGAAHAYGLGSGAPGERLDPARVAALYRRLRADPKLRRIADLAGKFRRVARARQKRKTAHDPDDVVGVVPGRDVHRLLPVGLAALADPDLEWDALRQLAEGSAPCREWRGAEPVGKGPVIFVVDESGSMRGAKEETAKALALAMAWVARRQRRWCGLVAFSGGTGERLVALPPGRWDDAAVLDWVGGFIGGGNDRDVPIVELPDYYRRLGSPPGKTDVVLVTDAVCRLQDAEVRAFNDWRRSVRARATGVVIRDDPGDLARCVDEVYRVNSLSADSEAVETVLGV